ncbi:hypothetical protein AciM339_0528 [Aciduliprofundum sp. MAR08-339]|uniref:hypothetical protein n=1 Tax=Aciduliprofundum sp. (strain MAR08-339) TaxID=673860 RepID=UPI0002A48792|nr:hypothetical protein AciM339_0528 [Aciduliprofundum sp. MAR08-339]
MISMKDTLKIYRRSIMAISLINLILGAFIAGFGFNAIFTDMAVPKNVVAAFIFGMKIAYGSGLSLEFLFLLIGMFFVWIFYKDGQGDVGAMASFTASALLHIFTLSYAYMVVLTYEAGNILHPVKLIGDLVLWGGAGLLYMLLITLDIVLLGAAHTKIKRGEAQR